MKGKKLIFGLFVSIVLSNNLAYSQDEKPFKYDLSVEQKGRLNVPENTKVISEIPKNFKFANNGTLTVAISDAALFPLHDFASDNKTTIGFDPDLAKLIADSLGKKLKVVAVAWADWPLGLVSGKYDMVISNVSVTEERKERFDFSTYRKDVAAFFVKKNSPIKSITQPKDISGLRITTGSGTNFEKILLEWNREDVKAGLKPAKIIYYEDDSIERLALQSGRIDAIFYANPTLSYESNIAGGDTRRVGLVNGGWPLTADNGVVTRKGSGLANPVTDIINDLISDGTYLKLLKRWNLVEEGIPHSYTNPPGLPKTEG